MLILFQQYQKVILTLLKKLFKNNLYLFIGIFNPSGEPNLMHLLCYRAFAVDNHNCIPYIPRIYINLDS
jgi:hypothetical protein